MGQIPLLGRSSVAIWLYLVDSSLEAVDRTVGLLALAYVSLTLARTSLALKAALAATRASMAAKTWLLKEFPSLGLGAVAGFALACGTLGFNFWALAGDWTAFS